VERQIARLNGTVRAGPLVLESPLLLLASGTRLGLGAFAGRRFTLDLESARVVLAPQGAEAPAASPGR
jgi:hypothetical protein